MTAGDARHGRRDNGLVASEYAPAGDVDPRVGEHLLDVLALDGIAAYLRPSTDLHPVTRSNLLPNRPTDRLFVDRTHLATARRYLARLAADGTPGQPQRPVARSERAGPGTGDDGASTGGEQPVDGDLDADVEAEWAKIVAGFDGDPPGRSWPAAEEISELSPDGAGTAGTRTPRPDRAWPAHRPSAVDGPSILDGLDTFGAELPDGDDEGYTPPAPPPLPRPSLPTALGVAGIVGGLIVFLRPDLVPTAEGAALLLGFAAVLAGFVTLVWRLRPDEETDDPDDGAKV